MQDIGCDNKKQTKGAGWDENMQSWVQIMQLLSH